MPRPQQCRRIGGMPRCRVYKPQGVPRSLLEQVVLTEDEWEAVRLADKEGLYQEQAAERMNISRQTFGRILESAHRKIADALIGGKTLVIEGGTVEFTPPPIAGPAGFGPFPEGGQSPGPIPKGNQRPGRGRCGRHGRQWNQ